MKKLINKIINAFKKKVLVTEVKPKAKSVNPKTKPKSKKK